MEEGRLGSHLGSEDYSRPELTPQRILADLCGSSEHYVLNPKGSRLTMGQIANDPKETHSRSVDQSTKYSRRRDERAEFGALASRNLRVKAKSKRNS